MPYRKNIADTTLKISDIFLKISYVFPIDFKNLQ